MVCSASDMTAESVSHMQIARLMSPTRTVSLRHATTATSSLVVVYDHTSPTVFSSAFIRFAVVISRYARPGRREVRNGRHRHYRAARLDRSYSLQWIFESRRSF